MNEQINKKKKKRHHKRDNMIFLNQEDKAINTFFNQNNNTLYNNINQDEIIINNQEHYQYNNQDNDIINNDIIQNNKQFIDNEDQQNKKSNKFINHSIDLNEINHNIINPFNQDDDIYLLNDKQNGDHLSESQINTSTNKTKSSKKYKINKSITLAELSKLNKEKIKFNDFFINLETIDDNLKINWDIDYKYITANNDNIKLFISGYDNKYNSSLLLYNLTPALSPIINYINLINNNKGEIILTNLTKGFYTLKYTEKYVYEYCIGKQVFIKINEDYNKIKLLKVSIECNNEDCI